MKASEIDTLIGVAESRVVGLLANGGAASAADEQHVAQVFAELRKDLHRLDTGEVIQDSSHNHLEQFAHALFHHSLDAIVVADDDGVYVAANPAAGVLFGLPHDSIPGRRIADFAVSGAEVDSLWQGFLDEGDQRGIFIIRRSDESLRYAEYAAATHMLPNRHLSILRDVTERVQAQQAERQRSALIDVLRAVTMAANESLTVDQAVQKCLELVSTYTGWSIGHAFIIDDSTGELASTSLWYFRDPAQFARFRSVTEGMRFQAGDGLPGQVLARKQPVWMTHITSEPTFLRAGLAAEEGLQAAFAFPVLVGEEVVAVLEFFARAPTPQNPELLEAMAQIGVQLGRMFERQRMTKALALREARYRTVVSFISDYVYSVAVEPGGTVRNEWITDAFTRITGFTGEELDAESGEFRLLHHADRPIFDEHMQILLSGQARTAEYRIISKSGAVYWIRDTAYPEWDALQGRVVRIVGAVQDITPQKHKEEEIRRLHADLEQRVNERTMEVVATNTILEQEIAKHRQTEKLLQENLEFVQAITNASPDIIYVYDFAAQRTVYINDSIFDMLGYTVQEIQEGTVPFFQAHLHPDDRALVLARYQQLQAQADAQVVEVEHRFRAAGGEWRWLYNRTLVLRRHPNGTIWHILGVLQDVTERKQSQDVQDQLQAQLQRERQRLDEIISTVPGVVWESWGQPDTLLQRINFVSPQIEAMLGYSTDEWLVTPNFWLHIIHPDDQEQALHKTMEVYTSGSGGTIQFRLIRKDGRPLWVEIHIAIVCDENQVPVGMRGVTLDISARKQAEIDLAQSLHYLSLLHAIIQATFEQQAPDTIAGSALHRLLALMPCERASIILFDDDRQQASVLAVATLSTTTVLPGTRFSVVGLAGVDVIRRDQTYIVDDLTQLVQISPPVDTMIAEGLRSSISVPLKARGELIGALTIYAKEPNAFTTSDAAFLRQAGDHLGVTIDNGRLFTQVNAGRQRLQVLARQLIEVQETERRTLAHELHDEIGQALTALIINLQAAQRNPLSAQLALPLAESIEIVQQTLQQIRNISLDLRPSLLDDLGLVATLRWYLDRQSQRMNIPMYFVGEPITPRLPPLLEITCFRLVQEAITNVARHASARTVDVTLRLQGEHVDLTIHDDGVGFDVAAALARAAQSGSLGLLGMQERAVLLGGQVTIDSAPGMGTTIVARFPRALRTRLERRSRKG